MVQRPSTFSKLYTAVHTTPSASTTVTCWTVLDRVAVRRDGGLEMRRTGVDQRRVAALHHAEKRPGIGKQALDARGCEAFGLDGVALVEGVDLGRDGRLDLGIGCAVGGFDPTREDGGGGDDQGGSEGVAKASHGILRWFIDETMSGVPEGQWAPADRGKGGRTGRSPPRAVRLDRERARL